MLIDRKIKIIFGIIIVQIAIFFQDTALYLYEFGKILINTNGDLK